MAADAARAPAARRRPRRRGADRRGGARRGAVDRLWPRVRRRARRASAARRSSRRRWCSSSCCGTRARTGDRGRAGDGGRDVRGDGPRRHLRPARRRLRALLRRPRLGGAALREDALRQRAAARASTPGGARRWGSGSPRRRPTSCSASCAPPRAASPPRSTPTPRARRAASTSGRRPSWSRCSARTTARGRPTLFEVTDAGTFEHGASTLQLLADPDDPSGWPTSARGCSPPASDAGAAGPRRQGGRRLERSGDRRRSSTPGRCSAAPDLRRRGGRGAGELLAELHLRRRPAAAGSPATASPAAHARRAGGPRLRRARLPRRCAGATGDAVWLDRAAARARRTRWSSSAPRTAASTTPPATPRRWSPGRGTRPTTPARPGCRRWCTRCSPYAALTGAGRHREAAEEALGTVAALAEQAPRFAGWSLAAAEAMLDGPARGRGGRPGRAGARRAGARPRAAPRGVVVVVAEPGDDGIPLLHGARRRSTVDPAAYVCREMVCERPVTTVAELTLLAASCWRRRVTLNARDYPDGGLSRPRAGPAGGR